MSPQPGNEGRAPHVIDQVWVWVAQAPDGDEGVPAYLASDGLALPLLGADAARLTSLTELARRVHHRSGQRMELRRFTFAEVVEVLDAKA